MESANHTLRERSSGVSILATSYFRSHSFARAGYSSGSLDVTDRATFTLAAVGDDALVAAPVTELHQEYVTVDRDGDWQRLLSDWIEAGVPVGRISETRIARYGDGLELQLGQPLYDVPALAVGTTAVLTDVDVFGDARLLFITPSGVPLDEIPAYQAIEHRVDDE